jgi:heterodisulfide reductase subunit B
MEVVRDKLGKHLVEDPEHTTCTGIGYHCDVVPWKPS